MKNYCFGCKKEHDDFAWKYADGKWICSKYFKPSGPLEMVPGRIVEDREKYFNSTLQPYRQGELSKEYIEAHGTKGIDVSREEVKKAKYVWKDLKGWENRSKSK